MRELYYGSILVYYLNQATPISSALFPMHREKLNPPDKSVSVGEIPTANVESGLVRDESNQGSTLTLGIDDRNVLLDIE